MNDVVSISGARILSIDQEKCMIDDSNQDTATLKFTGEHSNDRSYNFAKMFGVIETLGVHTYFRKQLSMVEHQVSITRKFPLICTVRNIANAHFAKQFGVQAGHKFKSLVVEWQFEASTLSNPYITPDHIAAFDIVEPHELKHIQSAAQQIFYSLSGFFAGKGHSLGSVRLRFGQNNWGQILLVDEVGAPELELWSVHDFSITAQSHNALRSVIAS